MKKFTARELALSALSCAFVTIFMTVGVYSELLLFTGYLFSELALMLPLAKKSYKGYAFAYVGGSILSLIFNAARFMDVLPFIFFFGLHPLVNELQLNSKINTWVACFLKEAWFDAAMYVVWRFVFKMTTTISLIDAYILPVILIFGTAFFVFYDYTAYRCRAIVNRTVDRLTGK